MNKRNRINNLIFAGIILAVCTTLVLIPRLLEDTFILQMGVRGAGRTTITLTIIAVSILVGAITIKLVGGVKSKKASRDITDLIRTDDSNPNNDEHTNIVRRMSSIMVPIKSLKYAHDELLGDIASIKTKRTKIKDIAQENSIDLVNVKRTLENSETTIFKNIQKALNCATLWDVREEDNPAFADIYNERHRYIKSVLEINDKICVNCDKLLSQTVKYVNAKSEGLSDNAADISSMDRTLQTLQGMNEIVDDFKIDD